MRRRPVPFPLMLLVLVLAGGAAAGEDPDAIQPVQLRQAKLGGFWKEQAKLLAEKWIPHCIEQIEPGGRGQELLNLLNTGRMLRGQPVEGKYTGCPWSDAYPYNTAEAICMALTIDPDGDTELAKAQDFLRRKLEEWIPIFLAAQCEDGYIHSYHVINRIPRYSNIGNHEFYVQGYFLELGVAHGLLTNGKDRRLYDAAKKCADHLCNTFGPPPKRTWVNGHPGLEFALCRLARLVNEVEGDGKGDRYADLTKYQYDTHAKDPHHRSPYHQSHMPAVEQSEATGHAVRATYFYTGIADLALLKNDPAFGAAADRLWDSTVNRKLYLTGGVGSEHKTEAFGPDYHLPNDGYCESCASCGLSFWADRMHRLRRNGHCLDVQERVLYNNVLGSIERSGVNFYYQNPLRGEHARYPWHGCPCCVGNIPRTLLAIKDLTYWLNAGKDTLYVGHFVAGECTLPNVAGGPLRVKQETRYPWKGKVAMTLHPDAQRTFSLKLRIPDRNGSRLYTAQPGTTTECSIQVNGTPAEASVVDGYATIRREWTPGDRVELALPMPIQRVHCDERVAPNRGRVALQRGPLVYNIENVDLQIDVRELVLKPEAVFREVWRPDLLGGVMALQCDVPALLAVPNYARLNRGGWSQVWLVEDPAKATPEPIPGKPLPRPDLDPRTIDKVVFGNAPSEQAHKLQQERSGTGAFQNRSWRDAHDGGWFSYELTVDPKAKNAVLCTYWGDDANNRRFQIRVDGRKIADQKLEHEKPGAFFDAAYPIPADLIGDKTKVTVRIQAEPGATAGGLFDLRIVNVE